MLLSNLLGLALFALSCNAAHDAQSRKRAIGLNTRQSCPEGVDCATYDSCLAASDPCVDCECVSSIEPRPCPQMACATKRTAALRRKEKSRARVEKSRPKPILPRMAQPICTKETAEPGSTCDTCLSNYSCMAPAVAQNCCNGGICPQIYCPPSTSTTSSVGPLATTEEVRDNWRKFER